MSSYGYTDSEEELDVRIHRHRSPPERRPAPVHYVEARRPARPQSYYATGPSYLAPENRIVVASRSRSRDRSRERRSSPPTSQAPQAPIVINNYQNHNSDSDDDSWDEHHVHHRSAHSSHSRSRAASSAAGAGAMVVAPNQAFMTREEYELEQTRRELEELRLAQMRRSGQDDRDRDRRRHEDWELKHTRRELDDIRSQQTREREDRQRQKEMNDQAELQRAKRELDEIRRREEAEAEKKRIKKELEMKRLEEEARAKEEEERREKAEKEAIERYKQKELERREKEKREKEWAEKEYQRRLQEDLINSGVDEKDIQAIIKKEKVKRAEQEEKKERQTYTRMARRHLSLETLRVYGIDYEYDKDPNYLVIKRWVPEDEQDILWRHTKIIREKRERALYVEIDEHKKKKSSKLEPEFEWVRKKERRRSKSPGLLMYLAGAR
ncbi:uncharacterized protein E0L32_003062 [Thyridium curvatum]|uniref:DUF8035 domain-containing protein n=1 Tax=Thyridium curvatum TaxID=1093900 RepID=A0A507BJ14_9PEZI|nr:uncharacterized protein E0L32_003062 [Thyridium curvatum]TPX17419.1 hypothetical protein E0L32_003062 [Thyridium curvatum]